MLKIIYNYNNFKHITCNTNNVESLLIQKVMLLNYQKNQKIPQLLSVCCAARLITKTTQNTMQKLISLPENKKLIRT